MKDQLLHTGENLYESSGNLGDSDDINLKEFSVRVRKWWKYIISKWVIIVLAGIIGGGLGLAYAFLKTPLYKAELSFALEDERGGGGGLGGALGIATQFGIDLGSSGGGAFSGDNLLELMKSRTMVEKTLLTSVKLKGRDQTLAELYIDINNYRESWKNRPELRDFHFLPFEKRADFSRLQDSLLGVFHNELTRSLSVNKVDKKLSIISVKMTSKSELFSKYFTECLVKEVSDFYVDTKTKKSVYNLSILQHQTDSVRRELNAAITGVAQSADVNPNINLARQVLRAPSQRRQVDVQANTAILQELVKNLEIAKVTKRKETPLVQIIDLPILPLEKIAPGKKSSLIAGGFLGGLLIVAYLTIRKALN